VSAPNTTTSPAERLLTAAGRLFAEHGIRAVGIDQILSTAGVARASLYQSYGSKEALVVAYLERQDTADRAAYRAAVSGAGDPAQLVLTSFDLARAAARRRSFRGCLYLNAATEFPAADHPVAAAVEEHRAWLRARWAAALGDRSGLVEQIQVLYDGGVAGAKASRSEAPITVARRMAEELLKHP
jgi:AcrR family transcriptional regulator